MKRPVQRKRVLATVGVGLVLTLAGWHAVLWPTSPSGIVDGFAFALVGMGILTLASQRWLPSSGPGGTVRGWSRRSSRHDGVASRRAIIASSSALSVRRKTAVLSPSTAGMSTKDRWNPRRVPIRSIATPVARVGLSRIWSPIENITIRFGGPRTGKSGELACRLLDAPGAALATSTRTDLLDLTARLRATQDRPVYVFNPCGLGGLPSTAVFDPLDGCEVPKVAKQRAADLVAGSEPSDGGGAEREYWSLQGKRVLSTLMHAAALGRLSMRDVLAWVADPDRAARRVSELLATSPATAFEESARQFLETNDRTRTSITSTIMPALEWLTDDDAAAAAGQVIGRPVLTADGVTTSVPAPRLDVEALISKRGTVYLLGAHDEQVAPLVTALTGHIARVARAMASRMPGGRLDPAFTMVLDEAALICPIPLDKWTADMGGRNITIHIAAQSRAQLRDRWGDTGSAALLNNAATVMLLGGTRDAGDLAGWVELIGMRDEHVRSYGQHGEHTGTSIRQVPVIPAATLANLPERRAVIIHRGMPPTIGTLRMAWQTRAVKRAARMPEPEVVAIPAWSEVTKVQSSTSAEVGPTPAGATT